MTRLFIELAPAVHASLLDAWRWLLRTPHDVVAITAMGNAFVADPTGAIYLLDTLEGSLSPVASSHEAFTALIASSTYDRTWFNPDMLALKEEQGQLLQAGQCYAYRLPPILDGPLHSSNVAPIDAEVHFSLTAQLHRHLFLNPDAPISGFTLKHSG